MSAVPTFTARNSLEAPRALVHQTPEQLRAERLRRLEFDLAYMRNCRARAERDGFANGVAHCDRGIARALERLELLRREGAPC